MDNKSNTAPAFNLQAKEKQIDDIQNKIDNHQKEIDTLQAEQEKIKLEIKKNIVNELKDKAAKFGITQADLGFKSTSTGSDDAAPKKARKPRTPKYQDGKGNTWVGSGRQPNWLTEALAKDKSKKAEDFMTPEAKAELKTQQEADKAKANKK